MAVEYVSPPQVRVTIDAAGRPTYAYAEGVIRAPIDRVWAVIDDVEGFLARVPLVTKVKRQGERFVVDLKFRLALFSVGFQFAAERVVVDPGEKKLEIRGVAGEPRGIVLKFEAIEGPEPGTCHIRSEGTFEIASLGWVVKYVLKHTPEIELAILPGVSIILVDAVRKAVG